MLSDLRESGAIEADADVVLFLWRGELYWPDEPSLAARAEVIIAKNRHGATGTVDLGFDAPYTLFRPLGASERVVRAVIPISRGRRP